MHLRKLSSGRWQAILYLGRDEAGKSVYVSGSGDTKTLAKERARGRARGREPQPSPQPSLTFSSLATQWLNTKCPTVTRRTLQECERHLRRHLLPTLGRKRVASIRPEELSSLLRSLPLARSTLQRTHSILREVFRLAVEWGHLDTSPADKVRAPRQHVREVQPEEVPTSEEVARLLRASEALIPYVDWLPPMIRFLATSCCRPGEACALWWSDIDWEQGIATIRASLDLSGGRAERKETKTYKTRRVPLDRATLTYLRGWLGRASSDTWVFAHRESGKPVRQDELSRRFKRACREAGVDYTPKSLRHFGATTLLARGVSPREVAERLGHSNPVTTLNVYAHSVPAEGRKAADLLGGLVT